MANEEAIIAQTKNWIKEVVVGCNFCPFAARELKRGSIHYEVISSADRKTVLEALSAIFTKMDNEPDVETSLLILPAGFASFTVYLQMIDLAEALLDEENYEGVYQIASFHPAYLFAGANNSDPSNYTNRSPYPMIHLLREASVTKAVDTYPDVDDIPQKNIAFATAKGLAALQLLREASMKVE